MIIRTFKGLIVLVSVCVFVLLVTYLSGMTFALLREYVDFQTAVNSAILVLFITTFFTGKWLMSIVKSLFPGEKNADRYS